MVKKNHGTHLNHKWTSHENKEVEIVQLVWINISQSDNYRKHLWWLLIKRTHSLFLNDKSQQWRMLGITKYVEVVFERGKMVKCKEL